MNILLTNDDGIEAEGLRHLAAAAARIGKVWIVAPAGQCSAMSHRITIRQPMKLTKVDYPLPVEGAWSLAGYPADCVKIGLHHILKEEKLDLVISGINHGPNLGYDTFYSGTVCAAKEGAMAGIPAIAVSNRMTAEHGWAWETVDRYLEEILRELWERPAPDHFLWNVNFPGLPANNCRGLWWEAEVYSGEIFNDEITVTEDAEGQTYVNEDGASLLDVPVAEGSDLWAVQNGYIAVGPLRWR